MTTTVQDLVERGLQGSLAHKGKTYTILSGEPLDGGKYRLAATDPDGKKIKMSVPGKLKVEAIAPDPTPEKDPYEGIPTEQPLADHYSYCWSQVLALTFDQRRDLAIALIQTLPRDEGEPQPVPDPEPQPEAVSPDLDLPELSDNPTNAQRYEWLERIQALIDSGTTQSAIAEALGHASSGPIGKDLKTYSLIRRCKQLRNPFLADKVKWSHCRSVVYGGDYKSEAERVKAALIKSGLISSKKKAA